MKLMSRTPEYLQTAADRSMIQDLLARYAWEIDHGTPEGWAALFTEDGIFEAPALGLWVQGSAALVAFARDVHRTLPNVHHMMSNFVIDVSGERARGRCELNEFMARPEAIYPNLQGWYEDEYVCDAERWRITHRRVFIAEPASLMAGKVGEYWSACLQACAQYQRT